MMEGLERSPLRSRSVAPTKVTRIIAGSISNMSGADATDEASSTNGRDQSPPEGGVNARDEEIERLQTEIILMQILLDSRRRI